MNGMNGRPGTIANSAISTATVARAGGYFPSWPNRSISTEPRMPPRDSRMAEAMEMMTAGIWVVRPSPTVRIE